MHCQPLCIPLREAIKLNLNPVCCQAGLRIFQRRKKTQTDKQYLQGFVLENEQKHEKICCSSCTYTVVPVSLRSSSLFCSPVIHIEKCLCCSPRWLCCCSETGTAAVFTFRPASLSKSSDVRQPLRDIYGMNDLKVSLGRVQIAVLWNL